MKKVIILSAVAFATWYFLLREKKETAVVVPPKADADTKNTLVVSTPPGSDTPKTDIIPAPASDNPQDAVVIEMMTMIQADYPQFTSSLEFVNARTRLYNASQPEAFDCIMAPCPTFAKVSKDVELQAAELISMLDKYAVKYQNQPTPVDIMPLYLTSGNDVNKFFIK